MTDNDLNEQVNVTVDDASVITVPIDATLQNSNEAADAKAVGDALALKADKSELQAAVKVNNQPADAQGLILIDGRHIPVSDQDTETLAEAVTDLKGQTAESIPMSSDSGAKTIAEVVNANSEAIEGMEEMTGATMPIESGSQTTVKAAIEARVKTVNRKAPDADGDVDLSVVPLAENLQSDKMESVEGSFIIRTTGGNASVSDGKAYPLHLFGSADHAGYVAEQLNMTVIPITRTEPDEPITATIDRDTFVAYVDESSTINLYYTTEWSADPELYGITVTGTPEAGDQITVVYVKEVRGTITVANPARLVGTGWNLFDYNNGYARVVKYSTEYGYKIGGSYTSLQFSATLAGERSSITPGVDGLFNVPSDGYVFVTGGNNTDTYILTTWSDWMEGPSSGYWEPYRESGIDLSAVMTTYFPNGLLAVGTTRDEIDLSAKRSISRIERMAYSEENRAAAAASGRSYDFDQNYIYIVRESAVISAITIDTTYNVSEHGLEWFTETTLPVISEILYGKNLRDKLERDVVTISAQTLTEEEKAQVRTNIGAMSQADGDKKLVAPTTAGTAGQLLHLKADGGTEWTTQGTPTDAQVGTAVSAWLTAHPEATTTVQDGAISRAKLNDDLKAKTDAVPDLKSAISFEEIDSFMNTSQMVTGKWVIGYIDNTTGQINTSMNTRITTLPYLKTQKEIHLVSEYGSIKKIVCTYNTDYSKKTRTLYDNNITDITIPAGSIFRVTVYVNDSSAVTDIYGLAQKLSVVNYDNQIRGESELSEMTGKVFVVNNADADMGIVSDSGSSTFIYSANNNDNYVSQTKRVSTEKGIDFLNMAKYGVRIQGTAINSNTINRYYKNGAFYYDLANAESITIPANKSIYMSAFIVFRQMPTNARVFFGIHDATNNTDNHLYCLKTDKMKNYTFTKTMQVSANFYVGADRLEANDVIDADIFVFVSENGDICKSNTGNYVKLFKGNDTLIVNDGSGFKLKCAKKNNSAENIGNITNIFALNVGGFNHGELPPKGDNEMYGQLIASIKESNDSVLLFTEWDRWWLWDSEHSSYIKSNDMLGNIRPYWASMEFEETNEYIFNTEASPYKILYEYVQHFDPDNQSASEKRSFTDCVYGLRNGENIHIIVTHLSWKSKVNRLNQIQEIMSYISTNGYRYAIIGGDFNQGTDGHPLGTQEQIFSIATDDVEKWTDEGYHSAQKGVFGDIDNELFLDTSGSDEQKFVPYDNIVTTSNIAIINAYTITNDESDHKAIYASCKIC